MLPGSVVTKQHVEHINTFQFRRPLLWCSFRFSACFTLFLLNYGTRSLDLQEMVERSVGHWRWNHPGARLKIRPQHIFRWYKHSAQTRRDPNILWAGNADYLGILHLYLSVLDRIKSNCCSKCYLCLSHSFGKSKIGVWEYVLLKWDYLIKRSRMKLQKGSCTGIEIDVC
jgi:hypothetical protein